MSISNEILKLACQEAMDKVIPHEPERVWLVFGFSGITRSWEVFGSLWPDKETADKYAETLPYGYYHGQTHPIDLEIPPGECHKHQMTYPKAK